MNLKKLLFLVSVFTLLSIFGNTAYAQYFVSNDPATGASDGRNGLAATKPTPDDGITGPKLTLTNAIAAAVAGQTITVASTGLNYTEALVSVDKNITILTTGTPVFVNANLNVASTFTMTGNFTFLNLTLNTAATAMTETAGGTLTITGNITRNFANATFTGTLAATGAANNLIYGAALTTGDEFPATGIDVLNVNVAGIVTVGSSKTVSDDVLVLAGGTLAIGTTTMSLTGASPSITIGNAGGITGTGTLAFTMTGAGTITGNVGAENIAPAITATSAAAQTLTINNTIENVGNLTANNAATITANNIGAIADVTNNGSGAITTAQTIAGAVTGVGNVTLVGSGNITLNHTAGAANKVTGNVLVSGTGTLTWGGNVNAIWVTGNVSLTTSVSLATAGAQAGLALITFPDVTTQVDGLVSNSFQLNGTPEAGAHANDGNGLITFNATNKQVQLAGLSVTSSGAPADNGGLNSTSNNNGNILFAYTTGAGTFFTGTTVTNSANFSADATASGIINFTAGAVNGPITVTTVLNNSTSTVATCGTINFGATRTGNFTATSVTTTGTTVGGFIGIGDAGTVQINGNVTNSRTIAGANINIGNGATAIVNITGSYLNSGASNVIFNLAAAAAVTVTGSVTNSGGGTTSFATIAGGTFACNGLTVNNGVVNFTLYTGVGAALNVGAVNLTGGALNVPALNGGTSDFACSSFTMSGGTHVINGTAGGGAEDLLVGSGTIIGNVSLTGGTLDLTNITTFTTNGTSITIGGVAGNATFTGAAATTFTLDQPIPNVLQTVTIGNFAPVWPGHFSSVNPANLPAVTQITGGNLTIFGNFTINNATVNNATSFNGAKFYLGDNAVAGSGGIFTNTTGYTSSNDGRVVMAGNVAQQIVPPAVAGRYFGSLEVDNNSGAGEAVFFNTTATNEANGLFTDFFYLTEGTIEGQDVDFVSVNGSFPHLVRNAGSFVQAPAFTNLSDLTYIGTEKTTALEVPATMLRNMTVATTNHTAGGVQAGWGVVTLGAGATVNGILTVNLQQTLNIAGFTLTMAGPTVQGAGDIAGTGQLALANATGVSFAGFTGYLPNVTVNNGSMNNMIATSSVRAIVNDLLNADLARNNGNDDTTADGTVAFAAGADAGSSLTLTFSGAGPHLGAINMNGADQDQTLTLGSNVQITGNLTHAAGVVNLGGFTLDHRGTAPAMTVGATIVNGLLYFQSPITNMTVTGPGTAVIGANFQFQDVNNNATVQTFSLLGANLQINGTTTLSNTAGAGDGAFFDIGAGLTLTAGNNVTVQALCGFTASGAGTGILSLNPVTPPLVYNTPGGSTVANLTVVGDVNLTGLGAGNALVVNGNHAGAGAASEFYHTGGNIDIGSANLQIGDATGGAVTDYTRTGGTYSGTGFLVWNSNAGVFTHGPALVINNLRVSQNLNLVSLTGVTVNDYLHLNGFIFDHTPTTVGYLTIGDGVGATTVEVSGAGNMNNLLAPNDVQPAFIGQTDYLFTGAASNPNIFTWPASQATNVTLNTVAGGTIVTNSVTRTILGNVDFTAGVLQWDSPIGLTLTDGTTVTRRLNASKFDRDASGAGAVGGFTVGNINLAYQRTLANDIITTDIEYSNPTTVNNFSLLANTAAGAGQTTTVTIAAGAGTASYARTISGTLSMASVLNINLNTTFTLAQTIPAVGTVNLLNNTTATWTNGLTVNGVYTDLGAGSVTLIPTGGLVVGGVGTFTINGTLGNLANPVGPINVASTAAGAFTNNGTVFSSGVTGTGASIFGINSIMNLTGAATLNALTIPVIATPATINTSSDLTFVGAWANANTGLVLNFTGNNAQAVALGANRVVGPITLNKTSDQTVTVSGGNLTLEGVTPSTLTLTRGVLSMINPALLTLNPTVNGAGFITALGYVRNPANNTDLAHIIGKVGVFLPVATLGRAEWPVGSATRYRPAAITFTAGNATIAPTTIIVSHVDQQPITAQEIADGNRPEFPLDGGTKVLGGPNPIGAATPYYWLFEATTSLGAAQLMNVELNGTDVPVVFPSLGNRNHNDLRIIKRFDGNVAVNRYNVEGSNNTYSNALYENTPVTGQFLAVVRNLGSLGSAISQRAIFTIGLPSQAPIFNVANVTPVAMTEATLGVLNTNTSDHSAADPDVAGTACTYGYTVTPALPTGATAALSAGGVLTFTPGWNGGSAAGIAYTFVITATKADGSFATRTKVITVTNSDRPATWTTQTAAVSVATGATATATNLAADLDGDAIVYTQVADKPITGTVTLVGSVLSYTPTWADLALTPVTFTVTATSNAVPIVTNSVFTITSGRLRGDVRVAGVGGAIDNAVTPGDATRILRMNVGLDAEPVAGTEDFWAADVNRSGAISPVDAAWVLNYYNSSEPKQYPDASLPKLVSSGSVAIANPSSSDVNTEGRIFNLPIVVTNPVNITAAYVNLNIDNASADVKYVNSNLPEGTSLVYNYENGVLRIAIAGLKSFNEGTSINVGIELKNKEVSLGVSGFAQLNDNETALAMTSIKEIPTSFGLENNYPNPFNPTTIVKYQIASDTKVSLVVYDMLGRVVRTVVDQIQEAGYYSATWNGTDNFGAKVSSGVYIYRLQAGSFVATKKMNLIK